MYRLKEAKGEIVPKTDGNLIVYKLIEGDAAPVDTVEIIDGIFSFETTATSSPWSASQRGFWATPGEGSTPAGVVVPRDVLGQL